MIFFFFLIVIVKLNNALKSLLDRELRIKRRDATLGRFCFSLCAIAAAFASGTRREKKVRSNDED